MPLKPPAPAPRRRLWLARAARRCAPLIALLALVSPGTPAAAQTADTGHPRLLVTAADLDRMRTAAGLITRDADANPLAPQSDTLLALRMRLGGPFGGVPLPGEALAAAFLHVLTPEDPADPIRLRMIAESLQNPSPLGPDSLELAFALDWCWNGLDPAAREAYLVDAQRRLAPFEPGDSPLEPAAFREKLAGLALVLAVHEVDQPGAAWAVSRRRILQAARDYFTLQFPAFVAWRGRIPTSPARAADEELLTALAVELAGHLGPELGWTAYRDSVGRWLEHYVLTATPHPALQHQFLRDDGDFAPPEPIATWTSLQPLTAHLVAARTGDPAATRLADLLGRQATDSADPALLTWRWLAIAFPVETLRSADPKRLPASRNLEGAVVLRGGTNESPIVVWIDAGQPFLRRGQHFDAGHFLVHADGHLVVESGGDVGFEAISSKGGRQGLGEERQPFDYEQFTSATIAHNGVIFWDAARAQRWYDQRFRPVGGQTPREGVCRDFSAPPATQDRQTAALIGYGHNPEHAAAYVALDLTPAYDERVVRRYVREFLWLNGNVLIVVDRAQTVSDRVAPTWLLQLPDAPEFDGVRLPADRQVRGATADDGVWEDPDVRRLTWRAGDGTAAWLGLAPTPRVVKVVGGPATRSAVTEGPLTGLRYQGSSADGYEHIIQPSGRPDALNAWFQLGRPTQMGAHHGRLPHWGRIEVEPTGRSEEVFFVNVLLFGQTAARTEIDAESRGDVLHVRVRSEREPTSIELPLGLRSGGRLTGPDRAAWEFPSELEPDDPLLRLAD